MSNKEAIKPTVQILYVEDSTYFVTAIDQLLQNIQDVSFNLTHVDTLKAAINELENKDYDAVLLDLGLPDSQSLQTLKAIQDIIPDKAIILLTAEDDNTTIVEAIRDGAQDYLTKDHLNSELLKRTILTAIDRTETQKSLKKSEERFELVVKGTNDGIWDWDTVTDKIWFSDHCAELLGYDSHELPKSHTEWKKIIHENYRQPVLNAIQHHLKEKAPYNIECQLKTKSGKYRWFLTQGQAIWDKKGKPLRMAGSISDIHDRKVMEEELTKSEERYLLAVKGSSVGIWDLDVEKDVLYWSQQCMKIIGITHKLFVPRISFFKQRIHPDDRQKAMQVLSNHLNKREPFNVEYRLRHEQGHYVWVHVRAQAIWSHETHKATRIAGSIDDITARKKAEEERFAMELQLQQAQKLEAIGQLAAGVAHEINTPTQFVGDNINFFSSCFGDVKELILEYRKILDIIKTGATVPKRIIENLENIEKKMDMSYLVEEIPKAMAQASDGISRISTIVQAMKELSQPGSSSKELVDINRSIQNTITVSSNEWKYIAEISAEFDTNLPKVECLPNEINQVVLNMIVNAAHAVDDKIDHDQGEKGLIKISTHAVDDKCVIVVSDNGCGIPDRIKDRIFDPFFTTKEVGRGSGQGLALAHSIIVDKHMGSIEAESQINKGTTFRIQIPISATVPERNQDAA